jgi:hypothetical protein
LTALSALARVPVDIADATWRFGAAKSRAIVGKILDGRMASS